MRGIQLKKYKHLPKIVADPLNQITDKMEEIQIELGWGLVGNQTPKGYKIDLSPEVLNIITAYQAVVANYNSTS